MILNPAASAAGMWKTKPGLIIVPRRDFDQDSVNAATTWFYGKLSNVLNREISIKFTGLEYGVYNGKRGTQLPYSRNTVPVFSYDNNHWERFSDASFDSVSGTFNIKQIFSHENVWIAYTFPYTFTKLEQFLSGIGNHPAVNINAFGNSVQGRPLYMVEIKEPGPDADNRPTVWIIGRQHSFETGGTWALHGLLEFITSNQPEALAIRRQLNFRLCPMVNPDGVVNGGTRFNASGVDLNRHWNAEDPLSSDFEMAPETAFLKAEMKQARKEGKLDLWINIHNNDMVWNEDGDYMKFAPLSMQQEAHRLEKFFREELPYTGSFNEPGNKFATESAVSGEFGCLTILMEIKTGYLETFGRWTGKDTFISYGPGLARAASRYFRSDK